MPPGVDAISGVEPLQDTNCRLPHHQRILIVQPFRQGPVHVITQGASCEVAAPFDPPIKIHCFTGRTGFPACGHLTLRPGPLADVVFAFSRPGPQPPSRDPGCPWAWPSSREITSAARLTNSRFLAEAAETIRLFAPLRAPLVALTRRGTALNAAGAALRMPDAAAFIRGRATYFPTVQDVEHHEPARVLHRDQHVAVRRDTRHRRRHPLDPPVARPGTVASRRNPSAYRCDGTPSAVSTRQQKHRPHQGIIADRSLTRPWHVAWRRPAVDESTRR